MSTIVKLRSRFQRRVCSDCIYFKATDASRKIPSIADIGSPLSVELSKALVSRLGHKVSTSKISGQTAGKNFEDAVRGFIQAAIAQLAHLRPAEFVYRVHGEISSFVQYQHLAELQAIIEENRQARTALGSYLIKPDVIISRKPIDDAEINHAGIIVSPAGFPKLSPVRKSNQPFPVDMLHASISCKLTLRSDRSQNARTEGLNLIRHRKGHTPHIVVVTGEPMPTRISSLALGTGDIDCVYHFALDELLASVADQSNEALDETLQMMVEGHRLRDIADLPFDLIA